ncbi:MAG: thermonuclease family protein [Bacillaceae bacterium]|nr:thermonuclease family protein [Bacillaceae bacterium]
MKRYVSIILIIMILILSSCTKGAPDIEAFVTRVIDGDTVHVQFNGEEETVRLLLIDTPETNHPSKPVQPYGREATDYARQVLENKTVMLELGTEKRDKYGRMLAYVYIDGNLFNQMIIEKGLARVAYVFPPNDKYVDQLRAAEATAREQKLGIWSIPGYVKEDGYHEEVFKHSAVHVELLYDPAGPDRDCSDFPSQVHAQTFFEAAGGPEQDPHRLDQDEDGKVCESLP